MSRRHINPKFRKGRDRIVEARERGFRHTAYAPTSVCTLTAQRHGEAVGAVTSHGMRTYAFRSEKARDQFVAAVPAAEKSL